MIGLATGWPHDMCKYARASRAADGHAIPCHAFTMIETLVVVAILALATTAGFVHLSASSFSSVRSGSRKGRVLPAAAWPGAQR